MTRWALVVLFGLVAGGCQAAPVVTEAVDRTVGVTTSVVLHVAQNVRFGRRRKSREDLAFERQMGQANAQVLRESWRRKRSSDPARMKKYGSYRSGVMSSSIASQVEDVRRRERLQAESQEKLMLDRARRELADADFSESVMTESLAPRLSWDVAPEASGTVVPVSNVQSTAIGAKTNTTELDQADGNPSEYRRVLSEYHEILAE